MEQTEQQYEYVTIKEFATLANVTTQAIYKRMNQTDSSLNKYVKSDGKMKLISKEALGLFTDSQPVHNNNSTESVYDDVSLQNQNNLFSTYFDATLKVLSEQINSKDEQIKELMNCNMDQHNKMLEQLNAKDKQISELQRLIDQQQQLHRAEQEQFRMLTTTADKSEKKGLFKRLFSRKEQQVQA